MNATIDNYFIENNTIGIYEQILEGLHITDCHTHIGKDRSGHSLSKASLLKQMKDNGIDKAIIFPLDDPNAGEDYHHPNEKILEAFKENPESLVPFFRLNPNKKWEKECELRISQGFRGMKIHPRSQDFKITNPSAMKIYDKIEKENLIMLIHAGFGLEHIADDLNLMTKTFSKLRIIVGHGGFPELQKVIKLLKEKNNVAFDTSTMRVFDLVELLKKVDYKKIFFGSDVPMYNQTLALQMLIDSAIIARKKPSHIKKILGENAEKWLK